MTVAAQFLDVIQNADAYDMWRWIEIEGLPYAYGNITKNSSFFALRTSRTQPLSIKPYFKGIPDQFEAQLDVLEAVAKFAGQVDFTLADIEGEQTLWAGSWDNLYVRELAATITKTSTTISYSGSAASTTQYPTGGGYIYIGNETVKYTAHDTGTKQFTGCSRGWFHSSAQAWKAGATISHKPYLMYGRRVWYYIAARKRNETSVAVPADTDKVLRFSGTIENLRLDDREPGAYVLSCVSLEREFNRTVFRDLRQFKDAAQRGIVGNDFTKPGIRFPLSPGAGSHTDRLYGPDTLQLKVDGTQYFTDAQQYLFRVDNELFFFQFISADPANFQLQARACMGTEIAEHSPGFTMKECAWIARYNNAVDLFEHDFSPFNSTPTATSRAASDHPLVVLLCLMLSTGEGTNNVVGQRDYDVLPESWGLGIPIERIDVAAFEALANDTSDYAFNGFWENEQVFAELAKEALAPLGMYALGVIGDLFTVRKLVPPLPNESTVAIDDSDIINKSSVGWDANLAGLVQEVTFNYNKDIISNRFHNQTIFVNQNARQYAQNKGRRLKYDLPHFYSKGPTAIPGRPPLGGMPNIELVLQERLDFFRQGFALAPPIVNIRVGYEHVVREVGSLVIVTLRKIPEVQSGDRGVTSQVMRVLKVSPDENSKTVSLTLQDTGFGTSEFGFYVPSFKVRDIDAGGTIITVYDNEFTEPTDPFSQTQYDGYVSDNLGNQLDWTQWLDGAGGGGTTWMFVSNDFSKTAFSALTSFDPAPLSGQTLTFNNLATDVPWLTTDDYLINGDGTDQVSAWRYYFGIYLAQASAALQDGGNPYKYYP